MFGFADVEVDFDLPVFSTAATHRGSGNRWCSDAVTLEPAQQIATHSSPSTTKLYNRTNDQITLDEIERIII